jgi:hypothetical protein
MIFDYKFLAVNRVSRINFTHKNHATVIFTTYFSVDFIVLRILTFGCERRVQIFEQLFFLTFCTMHHY